MKSPTSDTLRPGQSHFGVRVSGAHCSRHCRRSAPQAVDGVYYDVSVDDDENTRADGLQPVRRVRSNDPRQVLASFRAEEAHVGTTEVANFVETKTLTTTGVASKNGVGYFQLDYSDNKKTILRMDLRTFSAPRALMLCSPRNDSNCISATSPNSNTSSRYCGDLSPSTKPLPRNSFMNAATSLAVDFVCLLELSNESQRRGSWVYQENQTSFSRLDVKTKLEDR
uniref:Uncharacterized protein n=1 Tax=Hyaloperonospora arabidopsidis (strain Emoy2) TaxID=559515 RepID=M4BCX4_HYAAE